MPQRAETEKRPTIGETNSLHPVREYKELEIAQNRRGPIVAIPVESSVQLYRERARPDAEEPDMQPFLKISPAPEVSPLSLGECTPARSLHQPA